MKQWDGLSQIQSTGCATTGFPVAVGAENTLTCGDFLSARQLFVDIAVRDKLVVFKTAMAL